MKLLKTFFVLFAAVGFMGVAQASTAVCTAKSVNDCKKVRVSVTADGAGCKAEVEYEKIILTHKTKNHKFTYVLDKDASDKGDYFFDTTKGVTILEDQKSQAINLGRDTKDRKHFNVTVKNDDAGKYVVAYIVSVFKDGAPAVACAVVDPTIENR